MKSWSENPKHLWYLDLVWNIFIILSNYFNYWYATIGFSSKFVQVFVSPNLITDLRLDSGGASMRGKTCIYASLWRPAHSFPKNQIDLYQRNSWSYFTDQCVWELFIRCHWYITFISLIFWGVISYCLVKLIKMWRELRTRDILLVFADIWALLSMVQRSCAHFPNKFLFYSDCPLSSII